MSLYVYTFILNHAHTHANTHTHTAENHYNLLIFLMTRMQVLLMGILMLVDYYMKKSLKVSSVEVL